MSTLGSASQAGLLLSRDSAMSRFDQATGSPCLSRGRPKRFFGKHRAQLVLAGHESASGFAVDAASEPGDDGFAVWPRSVPAAPISG
jgi:hypothetical protein